MNSQLLIEIIHLVDNYETENIGKSINNLEELRIHLNHKSYESTSPSKLKTKHHVHNYDLENEIAKQVILLGRYSKHLVKRAMEDIPELSNEDFTYLFRMMDEEVLTKTQLIEKNAHEKQTGIEIINRLIKNGLFEENTNPEDKRSKLISITKKGKQTFYQSFGNISSVSKIMCGTLNYTEKNNLLCYLKELNNFHHTIYINMKDESLQHIEQYV